jgi:hypothetical protein
MLRRSNVDAPWPRKKDRAPGTSGFAGWGRPQKEKNDFASCGAREKETQRRPRARNV